MLDEVEADAPDDGHFVGGHGTKEFLHGDFLICDLCASVEYVIVGDMNDLGLKSGLFSRGADIKVWGWQNWLTPQLAAVGSDEANKAIPVWRHGVDVIEIWQLELSNST